MDTLLPSPPSESRSLVATESPTGTSILSGAIERGSGIAVEARGLSKEFVLRRSWLQTLRHPLSRDRARVLSGVSLQVRRGEFFGLLGPNGAGKTTFFKILSGLILPDQGSASVGGFDVATELPRIREILRPVVSDERSLMWRLSARENLRVYASLQGLIGEGKRRRIEEVLEIVDLADTGDKMVAKFSSGMKQRLLIARALLVEPQVLLLDEPTRSLDPVSARRFRTFLREEIVDRHGCTVLLATHNTEEALELCDRVGVLERGRLVRTGAPTHLMSEVRDFRYRLLIATEDWQRYGSILTERMTLDGEPSKSEEPGWLTVPVSLPGGTSEAAELTADLVRLGVRVGRIEPVPLSLAELIERVVSRNVERVVDHA